MSNYVNFIKEKCNEVDYNTGHSNTGNRNAGDWNVGDRNAGFCNAGCWNVGDRNSGDWNVGNWNSSSRNTGIFNTIDQTKTYSFNKETTFKDIEDWDKPSFIYLDLTKWIDVEYMTNEEKKDNPDYKTTGGYLKNYDYKEAFRMSWDKEDNEDRMKILNAPNFNNEIFKEISGIDVYKELGINNKQKPFDDIYIEKNGKRYKLVEVDNE